MYNANEHIRCIKDLLQEWAIKYIIFRTSTLKLIFFKDRGFTNKSTALRKKETHINQGLSARLSCRLHCGT
jgi:hypothetical protein